MNINKDILLKFKRLIKSQYFRANSCIVLALIVFSSTTAFTSKKNDSKGIDYKIYRTTLADSDINDNLYKTLNDNLKIILTNDNFVEALNDSSSEELNNSSEVVIDSNNSNESSNDSSEVIISDNNSNEPSNDNSEIVIDTDNSSESSNNNSEVVVDNNNGNENVAETEVQQILNKFNLTKDQFDTLVAIVLSEAKSNSYEDAYAVINTIYNRTISSRWVNYINGLLGNGTGTNLYYQSICPNQFVVYENGSYFNFLYNDNSNEPGYRAIIDFLTTGEKMHNFLSFVASDCGDSECTQFVSGGNCYYNELDDIIAMEDGILNLRAEKLINIETNQSKVKALL